MQVEKDSSEGRGLGDWRYAGGYRSIVGPFQNRLPSRVIDRGPLLAPLALCITRGGSPIYTLRPRLISSVSKLTSGRHISVRCLVANVRSHQPASVSF